MFKRNRYRADRAGIEIGVDEARYASRMKVLFICSQNRLRSPTAEQVFANWPGIETASAGVNDGAENPVTPELLQWADLIFVMERTHRSRLSKKFKAHLGNARMVCLEIPDNFEFMDPALVELLHAKMPRHLPSR